MHTVSTVSSFSTFSKFSTFSTLSTFSYVHSVYRLYTFWWLRCSLGYGSPDMDWELIAFVIIGLSTSREVASFNLPCIACRLMYLQHYLSFLTINPLWFGVFTSNIHLMKRSVGCRNIPLKWRFRPHPWWTTTSGRSHL